MLAPAHFRYVVISRGGSKLTSDPDTYLLKQIIRAASTRLGLAEGVVSYDRVWRGIRHEGAYSQVVSLASLPGQNPTAVGVIVFSYAEGYEVPLIPRPIPKPRARPAAEAAPAAASQVGEDALQVGEEVAQARPPKKPRKKKAKKPAAK